MATRPQPSPFAYSYCNDCKTTTLYTSAKLRDFYKSRHKC